MRRIPYLLIVFAFAGCGRSDPQPAPPKRVAKPKPAYCFFKDKDQSGWTARRDRSGNITVSGRLYRQDPRYMAAIGKVDVDGAQATLWPTVTINTGKYAAPENIWTVTATIPNSAAVERVAVRCGAKTFAELKVPAAPSSKPQGA